MKKKIALFMVAALLLSAGLILSCGGDDDDPIKKEDPAKETPAATVKYTVTFDTNGGTPATIEPVTVESGKPVTIANWPEDPERGTDTFLGWFDGATEYKPSTAITKDVTLTAKWGGIALFTVAADGKSAEHTNFIFIHGTTAHGGFNGTDDPDTANKFAITSGGIRYQFPISGSFDYHDYDFVEVTYTASTVADVVLKHYNTSTDYPAFSGSVKNGTNEVVTFEIRAATGGGFTIQKWNASSPEMTIEITKIVFKKGTRHTIKFNTDGGTPATLPDTYLVETTKVGENYLPVENLTKTGNFFAGWLYPAGVAGHSEGSAVSASDTVGSSYANITLKALWLPSVSVSPINVSIANLTDLNNVGATVALLSGAKAGGYSITNLNWQWKYVSFKVTIPAGASLANYNTVKFTYQGKGSQSDAGYKQMFLAAAATLPASISASTDLAGFQVSDKIESGAENADLVMTFTIVKSRAASLTGVIDVAIIIEAGLAGLWEISSIKFE